MKLNMVREREKKKKKVREAESAILKCGLMSIPFVLTACSEAFVQMEVTSAQSPDSEKPISADGKCDYRENSLPVSFSTEVLIARCISQMAFTLSGGGWGGGRSVT